MIENISIRNTYEPFIIKLFQLFFSGEAERLAKLRKKRTTEVVTTTETLSNETDPNDEWSYSR